MKKFGVDLNRRHVLSKMDTKERSVYVKNLRNLDVDKRSTKTELVLRTSYETVQHLLKKKTSGKKLKRSATVHKNSDLRVLLEKISCDKMAIIQASAVNELSDLQVMNWIVDLTKKEETQLGVLLSEEKMKLKEGSDSSLSRKNNASLSTMDVSSSGKAGSKGLASLSDKNRHKFDLSGSDTSLSLAF